MKNNIKQLYERKRVTFTLSERISAKSLLSCHLYVALFSLSTIIVIEATHLQVGPINRYTHVMLLLNCEKERDSPFGTRRRTVEDEKELARTQPICTRQGGRRRFSDALSFQLKW